MAVRYSHDGVEFGKNFNSRFTTLNFPSLMLNFSPSYSTIPAVSALFINSDFCFRR